MSDIRRGTDYKHMFDASWFLKEYHSDHKGCAAEGYISSQIFQELHCIFASDKIHETDRMLEFGTGPSIHTTISARNHVKQITCAEYAECNRNELNKWLKDEPGAHDWNPTFQFIRSLEDNVDNVETISKRIRSVITEVIPCDVHQKNPLAPQTRDPYDIIITSLTLEAACDTMDQYKQALINLSVLLKSGGHLIMIGVLKESFYIVNKEKFFCLFLTKADVMGALQNAGFDQITIKTIDVDNSGTHSNCEGYFVAKSIKS